VPDDIDRELDQILDPLRRDEIQAILDGTYPDCHDHPYAEVLADLRHGLRLVDIRGREPLVERRASRGRPSSDRCTVHDMTTSAEYLETLHAAYAGEVGGVALFDYLAATAFGTDPAHREAIGLYRGIEARTRDLLADLLRDAGADVQDDPSATQPSDFAKSLDGKSWQEIMEGSLEGMRAHARPLYARFPDVAPKPIDDRLETVIRHVDIVEALLVSEVAGTPNLGPAKAYLA
jgi:hypothetical protein